MRRGILVVATLAIVFGLSPSYAGHSETGTYTIGTTPGLSVVCSPDCLGEPGLNIGGYTFPAAGEVPVTVEITDSSGAPVPFTACQDFNEALCGEAGVEPRVQGCGNTVDLSTSPIAFDPSIPTAIFVRVTDAGCAGPALGGEITITYAASS